MFLAGDMAETLPNRGLMQLARRHMLAWLLACLFSWAAAGSVTAQSVQEAPAQAGTASGLAVPRFVSLKADRVNLRQGPGNEYPIAWVFRRVGLPVEVVKEFESWRQVRKAPPAGSRRPR
jgi:SH3-like domain-containing protein